MDKTFFLLDHLLKVSGIPVHYLSPDGSVTLLCRGFSSEDDPLGDDRLRGTLLTPSGTGAPYLHFGGRETVSCSFQDTLEHWVVMGPISLTETKKDGRDDGTRPDGLPKSDLQTFSAAVSMLCCQLTGKIIPETDLAMFTTAKNAPSQVSYGERLQPYIMDNVEQEFHRYTYADEQRIMDRIVRGDVAAIKKAYSMADLALVKTAVGKLADQPLKNFEYMICTSIAVASRAAIRGGLNDETAYSIADILLQELSRCRDAESMMRVQMETMHTFATHVKEAREGASHLNYVEKAKHYLNEHINKPFTLDALAAEVGLNKSYLCRRFKEQEGVTIFQYIKALRVEAAKNMLRYSEMELSAMASYLCFPSQSKFGEAFKQMTGVTPKRYRDENALGEGVSI